MGELHMRVRPQNSYAKVIFFVFFGLSIASFGASYAMQSYRWILQFLSLLCLVSAILMYTKFISCIYHYDLLPAEDASAIFVVRQTVGRRTTVLCRVELAQITEIRRQTGREARREKRPFNRRLYVYTPSFLPGVVYRMTVVNRYESADILIEGEEPFIDALRAYAAEQRAAYPPDEEE